MGEGGEGTSLFDDDDSEGSTLYNTNCCACCGERQWGQRVCECCEKSLRSTCTLLWECIKWIATGLWTCTRGALSVAGETFVRQVTMAAVYAIAITAIVLGIIYGVTGYNPLAGLL
jgi:hypothetical protein